MERRTFIQSSTAAVCAAAAGSTLAAEPKGKGGELYELRTYQLKEGKREALDAYLNKAFIPALKRFGIGPVGVFVETVDKGLPRVFVLIVHSSSDQFAALAS